LGMNGVESREICGWGRYPRARASVATPDGMDKVGPPGTGSVIARGQGRSYGDAAMLSEGLVISTERLSLQRSLDEEKGLLTAESGTTLAQILPASVAAGWFPSVVPGTKHVSLGGAV